MFRGNEDRHDIVDRVVRSEMDDRAEAVVYTDERVSDVVVICDNGRVDFFASTDAWSS